jgi:hypothetical protein
MRARRGAELRKGKSRPSASSVSVLNAERAPSITALRRRPHNTTRHHPMSSLRTWPAWSVITAVLLFSPALAFLLVMAVEILIDLLTEVGPPAPLAVAAGAFGYFLFRKMSPRPKVAPLYAGDEDALDEQAMAAPSAAPSTWDLQIDGKRDGLSDARRYA